MAQVPFDEAVSRFKDNEERFDRFVNDNVGYNRDTGAPVESVPAFLARVESEISATGAIAVTEANKQAAISAKNTAVTAQTAAELARDTAITAKGDAITAKNAAEAAAAGASTGIVGKATRADLFAALAYADGVIGLVTNDPTPSYNGYYRKTGASGSGSWVVSSYDRVANLEADNEFTKFYQTAVKRETARSFEGELFNGAQWFNGTTTSGATNASGGWKIPAGQTGNQTYSRYRFAFTSAESAALAGRKIRFLVTLQNTANLLTTVGFALGVNVTGTSGGHTNLRLAALDSTTSILSFDYTFTGNETLISCYAQVSNAGVALSADATLYATGVFYAALDARGAADAVATVGTIAQLTTGVADAKMVPIDESSLMSPANQVFNGAVYSTTGPSISVPAGQTGANSYITFHIPLQRELLRVGQTVTLELVLTTSDNLLTELANQYAYNINISVDGVASTAQAVAGTMKISQTGTNEVTITGDYVLRGGLRESVGIYFQIGAAATASVNGRSFTYKKASYRLKSETANDSVIIRRLSDTAISSGDLKDVSSTDGESLGGSVIRDSGFGLTIPVGQTGAGAYRRFKIDVSAIAKFVGSVVRVQFLVSTSTNIDAETPLVGNMSIYYASGSVNYGGARSVSLRKLSSKLFLYEYTYVLVGTEKYIGPYFQISSGASVARTSEAFITYEDLRFTFDNAGFTVGTAGTRGYSPAEQVLEFRENAIQQALNALSPEVVYTQTVRVKPDGTGDYTTLAAAIAAVGGGENNYRRILYEVYEGIYTDTNVYPPNFADVVGVGIQDKIWLKGELPDSVSPSTIPNVQTLYMNRTTRLKNLKITARNMRYPIHSDSGASAYRALQEIEDCYVEHIGNQGAKDYQSANGGDPNSVWGSEHAWGCGTHSGQKIFSRRTIWVSRTSPFYFHTNADFAEPCYVELDGGASICTTDTGDAIVVQPLGSGQPDRLVIKNGCEIRGTMTINPEPWLAQQLYNQRGDQNSEVEIHISGSTPVAWSSTNNCNVLELRSIDTANSSVSVSGTGAVALFGSQPDYVAGGVGFPGRAYSRHAITGSVSGASLAERLGDCTSTNKVLNITFDGSVNKTITLNQNYTGMTNAAIVSALNTALADGTRGFYEINPYSNACHVFQAEYERTILNTGSTSILKGMAVAFDGSRRKGRVATSADAADMFAGIALETIVPGQRGRLLKTKGVLRQSHILFSGTPSVAFNDTFGVSSTPGYFVEGASVPLIRCIDLKSSLGIFEIL